jgi:hypothetical protein
VRIVVLVGDAEPDIREGEPSERLRPARVQGHPRIPEGVVERHFAGRDGVAAFARGTREGLRTRARRGAVRRGAGEGVHRQAQGERALVPEGPAQERVGAQILHAPVALAVVQHGGLGVPAVALLRGGERRYRPAEQRARRGGQGRADRGAGRRVRLTALQLHPQPPPPKARPPLEASLLK